MSVPGGGRLDYMRVMLQRVPTLMLEEGVAYIEYAKTLTVLHYKGLNVHKVGALLITPALSAINDLKDYRVNACPLHAE